jgi:hypothetical protein
VRRERIEVVSAWVGTGGGVGALAAWLLADNFASSVGSYTGIGSLIGLLVGLIRAYTERAVAGGVSSRTVAITRIRSQLLASGFDLPEALYEKCPTDLVLAHSSSGDSPALSRIGVLRTLDRAAYRLVMCGRVGCGIGEAAVAAALTLLDRADSTATAGSRLCWSHGPTPATSGAGLRRSCACGMGWTARTHPSSLTEPPALSVKAGQPQDAVSADLARRRSAR